MLAYSQLTSLVLDRCKLVQRQFLADLAEDHPFARLGRQWYGLEPLADEKHRQFLWEERKQQHFRAMRVQNWWRMKMAQALAQQLRSKKAGRWAVLRLQSRHRGALARGRVSRIRRRLLLNSSALRIQRAWIEQKALWEEKARRREARELRRQNRAALKLQKLWRGHEGRKVADGMQRRKAEAAAAALREERRRDVAARVLQAGLRACLARWRMHLLRDEASRAAARKIAEHRAAQRLQWAWQRKQARGIMHALRLAREEAARRRAAAIRIQCCWRCMVARGIAARLWDKKYRLRRKKAATDIQRTWRGALGRQQVAVRRAWAHLLMVEEDAAMRIQTRWRVYQARGFVAVLQAARDLQRRKHAAAIGMQRVWRGVLGADEGAARAQHKRDLEAEQEAIRQAKARREAGDDAPMQLEGEAAMKAVVEVLGAKLEKLQKEKAEAEEELGQLEEKKKEWEAELESLSSVRAQEVDSDKISGSSQRYPVPWLRERLVQSLKGMEGKRRVLRLKLDGIQEQSNEASRRLRAAQREVAPLQGRTLGWAKEQRRLRWKRWGARRAAAAAALQAGWRGAEVRAAVARGGNPWVCVQAPGAAVGSGAEDDPTAWYFYNPVTQASKWTVPLEYRVWGGWLPRGIVEHQEADRLAWIGQCAKRKRDKAERDR